MIWIGYSSPGYYRGLLKMETIPMVAFYIVIIIVAIYSYLKSFSLIPVLGMTSCFYLMAKESHSNWYRFLIWLGIGLVVYFLYGRFHSKLSRPSPDGRP